VQDKGIRKIGGFKGIWFDLGQSSEYGSKYSGGLGTYTAKHVPLAVYSEPAEKTFFVYGGTRDSGERHLLAMVSCFDHSSGKLAKPVVVHDKDGVDDPHDNPSISIDEHGCIWVFVSGRGQLRPGYKYRSKSPLSIEGFDQISEEELTYPQPWWIKGEGFLHLFTRYTRGRELYWNTSDIRGGGWSEPRKMAGMGGHYQMSACSGNRVITAFNMHPEGDVDRRTNLYFLQTTDRGETWRNAAGEPVRLPLETPENGALVRNYAAESRLVYMKDISFDDDGNPVLLVITSAHHLAGPGGDPRIWTIVRWDGSDWRFSEVTRSSHNYDMGSLYNEGGGHWRIIGPTEPGPQYHGTGGEMAVWQSSDNGGTWKRTAVLTSGSPRNHAYARRPVNARPGFYAFWADGNPDEFSESRLYYCTRDGVVREMPYVMEAGAAEGKPL
jgi:hypothetical protein